MLPLADVLRKWDYLFDLLGKDNRVFIRPNSGEKEFNGNVVNHKNKDVWQTDVISVRHAHIDEICVISSPVDIISEYRLVIVDGKIVTGSLYKEEGVIRSEALENRSDCDDIINFAQNILNELSPPDLPPAYVFDVAKDANQHLSVLEIGCFCCCGLYACDLHKIAITVSECVEKHI